MMHSLKYLLLFLMIFTIGGSMYIATLDGNYTINESKLVKIPVEVVFEEVSDFNNWKHWETWIDKEAATSIQINQKKIGDGASYSWINSEDTITVKTIAAELNKKLVQEVDLGMSSKPALNWEFVKTAEGTQITVEISGNNNFKEKIFLLFKDKVADRIKPVVVKTLDKLERYLVKKIDEHSFTTIGVVEHGGGFYVYKSSSCKISKIQEKTEPLFNEIELFLDRNSLVTSGHKFVLFHTINKLNNSALISTCIPVNENIITDEDFFIGYLEPKKMYKLVLKGDYKYAKKALELTYEALKENSFEVLENGEPFEVYKLTAANSPNPANWETEFFVPIK